MEEILAAVLSLPQEVIVEPAAAEAALDINNTLPKHGPRNCLECRVRDVQRRKFVSELVGIRLPNSGSLHQQMPHRGHILERRLERRQVCLSAGNAGLQGVLSGVAGSQPSAPCKATSSVPSDGAPHQGTEVITPPSAAPPQTPPTPFHSRPPIAAEEAQTWVNLAQAVGQAAQLLLQLQEMQGPRNLDKDLAFKSFFNAKELLERSRLMSLCLEPPEVLSSRLLEACAASEGGAAAPRPSVNLFVGDVRDLGIEGLQARVVLSVHQMTLQAYVAARESATDGDAQEQVEWAYDKVVLLVDALAKCHGMHRSLSYVELLRLGMALSQMREAVIFHAGKGFASLSPPCCLSLPALWTLMRCSGAMRGCCTTPQSPPTATLPAAAAGSKAASIKALVGAQLTKGQAGRAGGGGKGGQAAKAELLADALAAAEAYAGGPEGIKAAAACGQYEEAEKYASRVRRMAAEAHLEAVREATSAMMAVAAAEKASCGAAAPQAGGLPPPLPPSKTPSYGGSPMAGEAAGPVMAAGSREGAGLEETATCGAGAGGYGGRGDDSGGDGGGGGGDAGCRGGGGGEGGGSRMMRVSDGAEFRRHYAAALSSLARKYNSKAQKLERQMDVQRRKGSKRQPAGSGDARSAGVVNPALLQEHEEAVLQWTVSDGLAAATPWDPAGAAAVVARIATTAAAVAAMPPPECTAAATAPSPSAPSPSAAAAGGGGTGGAELRGGVEPSRGNVEWEEREELVRVLLGASLDGEPGQVTMLGAAALQLATAAAAAAAGLLTQHHELVASLKSRQLARKLFGRGRLSSPRPRHAPLLRLAAVTGEPAEEVATRAAAVTTVKAAGRPVGSGSDESEGAAMGAPLPRLAAPQLPGPPPSRAWRGSVAVLPGNRRLDQLVTAARGRAAAEGDRCIISVTASASAKGQRNEERSVATCLPAGVSISAASARSAACAATASQPAVPRAAATTAASPTSSAAKEVGADGSTTSDASTSGSCRLDTLSSVSANGSRSSCTSSRDGSSGRSSSNSSNNSSSSSSGNNSSEGCGGALVSDNHDDNAMSPLGAERITQGLDSMPGKGPDPRSQLHASWETESRATEAHGPAEVGGTEGGLRMRLEAVLGQYGCTFIRCEGREALEAAALAIVQAEAASRQRGRVLLVLPRLEEKYNEQTVADCGSMMMQGYVMMFERSCCANTVAGFSFNDDGRSEKTSSDSDGDSEADDSKASSSSDSGSSSSPVGGDGKGKGRGSNSGSGDNNPISVIGMEAGVVRHTGHRAGQNAVPGDRGAGGAATDVGNRRRKALRCGEDAMVISPESRISVQRGWRLLRRLAFGKGLCRLLALMQGQAGLLVRRFALYDCGGRTEGGNRVTEGGLDARLQALDAQRECRRQKALCLTPWTPMSLLVIDVEMDAVSI